MFGGALGGWEAFFATIVAGVSVLAVVVVVVVVIPVSTLEEAGVR